MSSWLEDFVEFSSYGESSPKIMYWVGVSMIAGALRRKVWIEQNYFQWTPNFYVLIVGPPGTIKKSTSINLGLAFLKRVPGIDFGPQSTTWQQLITHMANARQTFDIGGKPFEASCCTITLSEFGSFFDPANRELVDNLTDMWDGKLGTIRKETKTMGDDEIVNPWLNIAACTTPGWLSDNLSRKLLRSGFASRPIFLYEDTPTNDVPYPKRNIPDCATMAAMEASLVDRLNQIALLAGECDLTEEAYVWGERWYAEYRKEQRSRSSQDEASFYERKQTHLHKLAMVIAAAKGGFPVITVEHLEEADYRLRELAPDVNRIFGFVGQTRLSAAASELYEVVKRAKTIRKSLLFRRHFFRMLDNNEFELALKSAQSSGLVKLEGPMSDPMVTLVEQSV